jgi:hypothetical protein
VSIDRQVKAAHHCCELGCNSSFDVIYDEGETRPVNSEIDATREVAVPETGYAASIAYFWDRVKNN